jgi:exosome complex protein LRP1
MDPQTDLPDLVEDLEVNIDELTSILAPLLSTQLSTTASSLPLLDKSKLYVLAAYSIESLLYSSLAASGANAKEHAIFAELARLKGYFGKIKRIEEHTANPTPKTKLDVGAAARFIKHGLAGNDRYDLERAERMAKERARAHLKARQINKKFDDEGNAVPLKRDAEDAEPNSQDVTEASTSPPAEPSTKKPKLASEDAMDVDVDSPAPPPRKSKRGKKKSASPEIDGAEEAQARPKRKKKKDGEGRKTRSGGAVEEGQVEGDGEAGEKPKRTRGRPKKAKAAAAA